MAVLTDRQIQEGERISWRRAVAWYEPASRTVVCFPVPLNVLARWTRNLWFWVLAGHGSRWESRILDAERRGAEAERARTNRILALATAARDEERALKSERQAFMDEHWRTLKAVSEAIAEVSE